MDDEERTLRKNVLLHMEACIRNHFFDDHMENPGYYVTPTPDFYVCKLIGAYWNTEDRSGPCPIFAVCPLQGWKLLVDRRQNT